MNPTFSHLNTLWANVKTSSKRIVHSFITLGETLFECRSAFCTHPSKEEPAKHTKARYIKVKDIARRKASGHFKHEHQDLVSQSSQPAIVKPLS
ncbi:hypothetical protein GYH30_044372 [Glycine max]|nr:hypothetical protein GYH30_044372 [Glycine max]